MHGSALPAAPQLAILPSARPFACQPTRASRPADSSSAPSDSLNTGMSQLQRWWCPPSFSGGGRCASGTAVLTKRLK